MARPDCPRAVRLRAGRGCACERRFGRSLRRARGVHHGRDVGGVSGGPSAEELAGEIRTKLPSLELTNDGRLAELAARVAVATQDKRRAPGLTELDALARDVGFVGPVPFIGVLRYEDGKWDRLDDYFAAIPNNMRFNRLGVSVLDFGAPGPAPSRSRGSISSSRPCRGSCRHPEA